MIRRHFVLLSAVLLACAAAGPPPVLAQDSAAMRSQRERMELKKLRVEIRQVEADTRKADAETANLRNRFLRIASLVTAIIGIVGAGFSAVKYLQERRDARRNEIRERIDAMLGLLAGSDPHARVTAATSLGVLAASESRRFPWLPDHVIRQLLVHMASNPAASEQSAFAGALTTALAGRKELAARPQPGTDLSNVTFGALDLRHLILNGARLAHTSFRGTTLDDVELENARACGTDFGDSVLTDVRFTNSELWEVTFSGARVGRLSFTGCKLVNCAFTHLHGDVRLRFEKCSTLFGLAFDGTDISNLVVEAADDLAPNTAGSLARAAGLAHATLDKAAAAAVEAEKA